MHGRVGRTKPRAVELASLFITSPRTRDGPRRAQTVGIFADRPQMTGRMNAADANSAARSSPRKAAETGHRMFAGAVRELIGDSSHSGLRADVDYVAARGPQRVKEALGHQGSARALWWPKHRSAPRGR